MFSNFSSFLPSALHLNSNNELPRPDVTAADAQTEDEDDQRSLPPERAEYPAQPSRGKDRDGKGASETFVFVRPPPSKSNHPLNLQVQLVPPNAKLPSGVGETPTTPTSASSVASESGSDGTSLRRTSSSRSRTTSINNNSTTSFSSVASSTTSSASSRRAIIPLYNLQAHNVMTNVIVDAGTDAKIARFQKRGIELIDLAMLEPVEVWGERDGRGDKEVQKESMRLSIDEMGAMVTNISLSTAGGSVKSGPTRNFTSFAHSGSRPVTPSAGSSAISLHSQPPSIAATSSPVPPSLATRDSPPTSFHRSLTPSDSMASMKSESNRSISPAALPPTSPTLSQPQSKRNIFGKLFKRNSGILSNASPNSSSTNTLPVPGSTPKKVSPMQSFSSFALHAAPTPTRNTPDRSDTPRTPLSPVSMSSQQSTPMASPGTPKIQEPTSPTPTVSPAKGHGRNLSLTSIATPIKATLKSNKNRLSSLVSSSPLAALGVTEEAPKDPQHLQPRISLDRKRDASPNPSVARSNRSRLSFVGSNVTVDSHSTESSGAGPTPVGPPTGNGHSQGGYPLMHTQTQIFQQAELAGVSITNLRQQQLQLRPPILGIQPSFVSASPSTAQSAIPGNLTSPLVAALSPREREQQDVLAGQRALMYVWLVRKWMKKRPSTILGQAGSEIAASVGGFFAGKKKDGSSHSGHVHVQEPSGGMIMGGSGGPPHLAYGGVEVRFEWKRAKAKDSKKGSRKGRDRRGRSRNASGMSSIGGGAESDGEVERASLRNRSVDPKERLKKETRKRNRMSTGSYGTNTSKENVFDSVGSRQQLSREPTMMGDGDDGDESDPEDSETPWVCTLKIRRSAAAAASSSQGNGLLNPFPMSPPPTAGFSNPSGTFALEPQILRIKVGTLSPTPHHPKVVGMLKVPYPLPDVEVERMQIVKRDARRPQESSEGSPKDSYQGLTLTAEEIKDIVCSTGLWLVVREGFGGVGKVSRKGDGWRIRA